MDIGLAIFPRQTCLMRRRPRKAAPKVIFPTWLPFHWLPLYAGGAVSLVLPALASPVPTFPKRWEKVINADPAFSHHTFCLIPQTFDFSQLWPYVFGATNPHWLPGKKNNHHADVIGSLPLM